MKTIVTIFVFLIAYLVFLTCSYRCLLGAQYMRYKRYAVENERPHSWLRFFLCVQLDPAFPKKYGRVSVGRLLLAALVAFGALILFASVIMKVA